MKVEIRQPESDREWQQYYDLRWRLLRAPWQQPRGSEKDELEEAAIHRLAIIDGRVVAVGRLHLYDPEKVQIRYMAVDEAFQKQSIGKQILSSLESAASELFSEKKIKTIELNARENAVAFYQSCGYDVTAPAHTLYGEIKHFIMKKQLHLNHQNN